MLFQNPQGSEEGDSTGSLNEDEMAEMEVMINAIKNEVSGLKVFIDIMRLIFNIVETRQ